MKKTISMAMVVFFLLSVPSLFAAGAPPAVKPPPPATLQPQHGGTLRIATDVIPTNFGNPSLVRGGKAPIFGCLEPLANLDAEGNLIPMLATSWDLDPVKKTITYHLRKGVKFHDGTDFNAAAAKWNLEQRQVSASEYVTSIEVIDNFTVRINLKQYSALFPFNFSLLSLMYSPTAIQTKGEEWSRANAVGTGPYKFVEYRRNASLKFTRFDGYWGERPFLDGLEFRIITDPMTASASMLAGETDAWFSTEGLPPKEVADLLNKGFKTNWFPHFIVQLMADTVSPNSPYLKKGVREALEHAIDKVSIAKTMGYGMTTPASQMALPSSAGFNKDYQGRSYDPAKAKQLLAESGYPNGFKTKLIIRSGATHRDMATAIQGYLAAVGIDAQLDVADTARFTSLSFDKNVSWNGSLLLGSLVVDPGLVYTDMFIRHFKSGVRYASMARSPEFDALVDKCEAVTDPAAMRSLSQQMVKRMADDVMTIPIVANPYSIVTQKYVYTKFLTVPCPGVWDMRSDWMEKK